MNLSINEELGTFLIVLTVCLTIAFTIFAIWKDCEHSDELTAKVATNAMALHYTEKLDNGFRVWIKQP